ncbi:MAG: hypothetical protein AAF628_28325 [Planctomycetota bacterium]
MLRDLILVARRRRVILGIAFAAAVLAAIAESIARPLYCATGSFLVWPADEQGIEPLGSAEVHRNEYLVASWIAGLRSDQVIADALQRSTGEVPSVEAVETFRNALAIRRLPFDNEVHIDVSGAVPTRLPALLAGVAEAFEEWFRRDEIARGELVVAQLGENVAELDRDLLRMDAALAERRRDARLEDAESQGAWIERAIHALGSRHEVAAQERASLEQRMSEHVRVARQHGMRSTAGTSSPEVEAVVEEISQSFVRSFAFVEAGLESSTLALRETGVRHVLRSRLLDLVRAGYAAPGPDEPTTLERLSGERTRLLVAIAENRALRESIDEQAVRFRRRLDAMHTNQRSVDALMEERLGGLAWRADLADRLRAAKMFVDRARQRNLLRIHIDPAPRQVNGLWRNLLAGSCTGVFLAAVALLILYSRADVAAERARRESW